MSERPNEHSDQAEQLKQIFDELQQNKSKSEESRREEQHTNDDSIPKIDVLNLPPRREVHGNSNVRTRLGISRPFLRFLSVIVLIVAIILGAYFMWGEELIVLINGLK